MITLQDGVYFAVAFYQQRNPARRHPAANDGLRRRHRAIDEDHRKYSLTISSPLGRDALRAKDNPGGTVELLVDVFKEGDRVSVRDLERMA